MLDLFEREGIDSIVGLQERLGESFKVHGAVIQLETRPGGKTILPTDIAYTVSYIIQDTGIPIEIRMNSKSAYSKITLKLGDLIQGYNPFFEDGQGNIIQEKMLGFSFDEITEELRRLNQ